MPMLNWPYKVPSDNLNYSVDWGRWLGTDTISTSTWVIPSGLTVTFQTYNATVSTVWLTGGTIHDYYDCVNTITTAGGQTKTATVRIYII